MIEYASSADLASPRDVVIEDTPQGLPREATARGN
jgi:hypothetical protein